MLVKDWDCSKVQITHIEGEDHNLQIYIFIKLLKLVLKHREQDEELKFIDESKLLTCMTEGFSNLSFNIEYVIQPNIKN